MRSPLPKRCARAGGRCACGRGNAAAPPSGAWPQQLSPSPRGTRRPTRPDWAGPVRDGPTPSDELTHYMAHLNPPAEGEVLVQEDKDKSAAWKMQAQLYSR